MSLALVIMLMLALNVPPVDIFTKKIVLMSLEITKASTGMR